MTDLESIGAATLIGMGFIGVVAILGTIYGWIYERGYRSRDVLVNQREERASLAESKLRESNEKLERIKDAVNAATSTAAKQTESQDQPTV